MADYERGLDTLAARELLKLCIPDDSGNEDLGGKFGRNVLGNLSELGG